MGSHKSAFLNAAVDRKTVSPDRLADPAPPSAEDTLKFAAEMAAKPRKPGSICRSNAM
jgi:hypothetical protein